MSTIEKLFVQIFERKKWIIDQAKLQTDLFDQQLASKLIIDGIVPPPWLQTSFLHSNTSHFSEVNEKFNSGVEFPRSSLGIHHSLVHGLDNVLVEDSRKQLQQQLQTEDCSLSDDFDAGARLSILPQCPTNDAGCALNGAPDVAKSPISPQGRGDVISTDYKDPTMSLARLQRSKSRQKALEIRNSVKSAKCRSRCDNEDDPIAGRTRATISSLQSDPEDGVELAKPSSYLKRSCPAQEDSSFCEGKDISHHSDIITTVESSGLQLSSLGVDNSSNVFSEDGGLLCPLGSSKRPSDQVIGQLDLSKSSAGDIRVCEEAGLGYCRNQEDHFETAEQSGALQGALDVDDSPSTSAKDGRLCPTKSPKLLPDIVEQLDLSKSPPGNIECREEAKLGYCKSQDCNFNNAAESGLHNSSFFSSEDENLRQIGSSGRHSDQVNEQLELAIPYSGDNESCEGERLEYCRRKDCIFDNTQQSEDENLCQVGISERHLDQVNEQLELPIPSSGNNEPCEGERLGYCSRTDYIFDNAEQSAPNKISSPLQVRNKSSNKKHSTFLDDKKTVNEKEKCNSSFDVPIPPSQVDLVEEEEPHKVVLAAHDEKGSEIRTSLSGNTLLSADKSLQDYGNAANCSLQLSDDPAKQNVSFTNQTSNLLFSHEKLAESPVVDANNTSVLLKVTDSFENLEVLSFCVPSSSEKAGKFEQRPKYSGSGSLQANLSDITDNYHCISTGCRTAETSMECSSDLKASRPHSKLRKIEVQLEDGTPASKGLRDRKLEIVDNVTLDQNLMHEDDNHKPILEVQRLSFHEEDRLQPTVSKSPVQSMHLKKDTHFLLESKSACMLTAKEDHDTFESNNRHSPTQPFMLENQTSDPNDLQNKLLIDTGTDKEEKENGKFSPCSLVTPDIQTVHYVGANKDMPSLEGFLMQADYEQPCIFAGGINLEKFDLSKSMIERASILEELCKSACTNRPLSLSLENFELNKVPNLYSSLPNGLLEDMDVKSDLVMNCQDELLKNGSSLWNEDGNYSPDGGSVSDCLQSFDSQSARDIRRPFASPFRKFLDGVSSNSSSSGKRTSSELPCISEESENTDEIDDKFTNDVEVITNSVKRVPLADIADDPNLQVKVSEAPSFDDRWSLGSLNTELSNRGTHSRIRENLGNEKSSKRKYLNKTEQQGMLLGTDRVKRVTRSSYNKFNREELSSNAKFKKEGPRFSEKESKHKNIVSNITSFIPLVQQRESAAILKGKRNIKVKAIEAAEAVKRLAEKKENERQMKKEALKLERARMEQENLRQMELEKKKKVDERKKKEEEKKKKEADLAAKKRLREEEEKKEKERKRMRVEEVRRRLQEHGGKTRYDKDKKEVKAQGNDQKPRDRKGCKEEAKMMVKGTGNDNFDKLSVAGSEITASTSGAENVSIVIEDSAPTSAHHLQTEETRVSETSEEQSYQISPYKGSDDEDDEYEDDNQNDILNNKFVPSWASKDCLALLFASQQKVNPEVIFPPESFCNISEVLLPRRHQLK